MGGLFFKIDYKTTHYNFLRGVHQREYIFPSTHPPHLWVRAGGSEGNKITSSYGYIKDFSASF